MHRSVWSRLLAAWLACWLPLVLSDGGWLHACPMHGGASHAMHGATHAAAHMAMPAADVAPSAGALHHDGAATHPAGHGAGHACTCAGACCAPMATLAAVDPVPLTVGTVARLVVPTAARSDAEYVAAWVDFVLPFATAPPAARATA